MSSFLDSANHHAMYKILLQPGIYQQNGQCREYDTRRFDSLFRRSLLRQLRIVHHRLAGELAAVDNHIDFLRQGVELLLIDIELGVLKTIPARYRIEESQGCQDRL